MDTKEEIRDADEIEDIEAAWAAEIEKRITEVESGVAETVNWEEARVRIRATLARP
jgi:hypothetical protein